MDSYGLTAIFLILLPVIMLGLAWVMFIDKFESKTVTIVFGWIPLSFILLWLILAMVG